MYSVQIAKERALATKIRRAKIMAKNPLINPDFATAHPSEVREYATVKKFTELEKRVKADFQKHLDQAQARREKLGFES